MEYKNTQIGYFSIFVFLLMALLFSGIYLNQPAGTEKNITGAAILFLVCLMVIFGSLTIKITGNELVWYFGPGIWKHKIKFDEIKAIAPVRTHFMEGFGIRWTPGKGMLYNVSGFYAIKVIRKNGKTTRIGTNEPQKLISTLQRQARLPDSRVLR